MKLHYVEAGDGPLVVLLHGFPEFWYGWRLQIAPLAAAGFRVVAPDLRGYNLSSKPDGARGLHRRQAGRRRARSHPRTRRRVRAAGRPRLGRNRRLDCGDEPPRGRGPSGHPQRGPSAQAQRGTAPPQPARAVLVLLLLRAPRPARAPRAREGLGVLPALPARRPAAVHGAGDRSLYRGVVAGRRRGRDDRLLPRRGATAEGHQDGASPDLGAHPGHLGREGSLPRPEISPSPTTRTSPTSTASSACPTRRTGSTTTRPSASHNCSSTSSPRAPDLTSRSTGGPPLQA